MVTPVGAYWLRVDLDNGFIEYLLGTDVVDIERIVDASAMLTLNDGRRWQIRVTTADALIAELGRWRQTAGADHLMSFTDLFVVLEPGLEAMTAAIATATATL